MMTRIFLETINEKKKKNLERIAVTENIIILLIAWYHYKDANTIFL